MAAVLAVGVAVVSRFYTWRYWTTSNAGDTAWSFGAGSGQVVGVRISGVLAEPRLLPLRSKAWWAPDWCWGYAGETSPYGATFKWHGGVLYHDLSIGWIVGASVLYPVGLTVIPAALLWYADRRRSRPGSCGGCGYDRAGLASTSPCPECGTTPTP